MDYSFAAIPKVEYLHIEVRGPNTATTVLRYLDDVLKACAMHGCGNVLIEERLEGAPMSKGEIFDIITGKIGEARPVLQLLAFVDLNTQRDTSNLRFGEDVAVNRGVTVKAFETVADAEAWIRSKIPK